MKQKKQTRIFILAGRVFSDKIGIAGMSIHAIHWDSKKELGNVLTNEDGGFHLILKEIEINENDKIQIVVYDFDKSEITKRKKSISVKFDSQTEIEIKVDDEKIQAHLSKVISLKPKEGRVFSIYKLNHIYGAINLYGNTKKKYFFGGDIKPGLTCPFPELNDFDDVLYDADGTMRGDSIAFERFKNSLDTISLSVNKRGGLKTNIDFNGKKWKGYIAKKKKNHNHSNIDDDIIIPLEKSALLMMAASYIAKKNKALANHYMNVVLSQVLEYFEVASIYKTCHNAMLGDKAAQSNIRSMIDIWGEDCGGRVPLPGAGDFGRGEWDPRREPIDPHMENMLACLDDLANGGRFVEIHEYQIDSLTPNNGCSGDIAIISGSGFGEVMGQVKFVGSTINSSKYVIPTRWTDTEIELVIPNGATYGPVDISFHFRSGKLVCGRVTSIQHRNVSGDSINFIGGNPRIDSISFTKNNVLFDPLTETVLPGDSVSLVYENSPNVTQHSVDVQESRIRLDNGQFQPSVSIQQFNESFPGVDGPSQSVKNIQALNYNLSTKITCEIDLTNLCGTTHANAYFIVHRPATISLTGVEVTQASQFFRADEVGGITLASEQKPDNSVPLIAGKQTLIRVYYTTDQVSTFNGGKSFGLSVGLTGTKDGSLLSNGNELTPFNFNVLFASNDNTILTQRGKLTSSANFLLPGTWIGSSIIFKPDGIGFLMSVLAPLNLSVKLGLRNFEPWMRDNVDIGKDQFSLNGLIFNRAKNLECVLVRIAYTGQDADVEDAPSLNNCLRTLGQISEAYPTDEVEVFFPANNDDRVITFDGDLTEDGDGCGPGWGGILDILRDLAEAHSGDDAAVWTALLDPTIPRDIASGCGGEASETIGVAAFPIDRHTTGMQEIGHGFGRDHPIQSDPDGDPNYPDYLSDDSPSIGEFGIRVADINPNNITNLDDLVCSPFSFNDFMSGPNGGSVPLFGRWVSPYTYMGLMDDFFATSADSSNTNSSFAERVQPTKSEHIIVQGLINVVNDRVMLKPLYHGLRKNKVNKGKSSNYSIKLLNEFERILFEVPVFKRGEMKEHIIISQQVPLVKDFKHFEIQKNNTVLIRITRSENSSKVTSLKFSESGNKKTIDWNIQTINKDFWCGVELTCDDGKSWTRLNELKPIKHSSFDSTKFGGGSKCRLRVFVTDGFNTDYKETDSFSLPIKPPQIVPINFDKKSEFIAGLIYELKVQPIYILGVPHRTELIWYLNDKQIGKGKRISVKFEAGKHIVKVLPEKFEDAFITVPIIVKKGNADDMGHKAS